jgi:chemotaxis protein methyltransferase CheR
MNEELQKDISSDNEDTLPLEPAETAGPEQGAASAKPEKKKKARGPLKLRGVFAEKLSDQLFAKLSDFINHELGIKMPDRKKVMLEARLRKRLRVLDIKTFDEYTEYVFSPGGLDKEVVHLLDVVTTNKTDFFREPRHYSLLTDDVLPELLKRKPKGEPLKIWSAACSSGEEPYTLAIVMNEFAQKNECPPYSIFGTDVSTQVLYKALDAIYKDHLVKDVDLDIKKKYFLRSKDPASRVVRLNKSIRDKVSFKRLNFMEDSYDVDRDFDIVFCRNVMIYFDRPTQEMVINRICRHIKPKGYIFMGHSETLMGIRAPLKQIVSTVYQRQSGNFAPEEIVPMIGRKDRRNKSDEKKDDKKPSDPKPPDPEL